MSIKQAIEEAIKNMYDDESIHTSDGRAIREALTHLLIEIQTLLGPTASVEVSRYQIAKEVRKDWLDNHLNKYDKPEAYDFDIWLEEKQRTK